MQKKTVRTGIVGAGFSATFHFDALEKVHGTNVEVVGVYAKDLEQAAAYAQQRGIRLFESLEALLDAVDAIHVCTPPVSPRADCHRRARSATSSSSARSR